jgi:hypothetical protein
MSDLLEECLADLGQQEKNYQAFQETFCQHCRNPQCVHAKWAQDKFGARVSKQVERVFNPVRIDPKSVPKYAILPDFVSMVQEAMRLEIADRRGDWEIPDVPIVDGRPQVAQPSVTSAVDDAVRRLAYVKGKEDPNLPDPEQAAREGFVQETQAMMQTVVPPAPESKEESETLSPVPPPIPPGKAPGMGNIPVPPGGIMLKVSKPSTPPVDPWTPVEKVPIVPSGAKIQLKEEPNAKPE